MGFLPSQRVLENGRPRQQAASASPAPNPRARAGTTATADARSARPACRTVPLPPAPATPSCRSDCPNFGPATRGMLASPGSWSGGAPSQASAAAAPSRSDARSPPCCARPQVACASGVPSFVTSAMRGRSRPAAGPASWHSRAAARPPGARRAGARARRPARGRRQHAGFRIELRHFRVGAGEQQLVQRPAELLRQAVADRAGAGVAIPACFSRRRNAARAGWPARRRRRARPGRARASPRCTGRGRPARRGRRPARRPCRPAAQAVAQLARARAEVEAAVAQHRASGPASWRLLAVTSWPPAD
jgi:hypothetical protein